MIDYKPAYKYFDMPPNTMMAILAHPYYFSRKIVELGVFNHHRFAFYFWAKWKLEKNDKIVPDLITFDWHQDLVYPGDLEKEWLANLDTSNLFEVSFFSWAKLNPLNDNHIVSAAYLNLIGDIFVVCKYFRFDKVDEVEQIVDINGEIHHIRKFENQKSLMEYLSDKKINQIYFDIDLDYFTIENSTSNDKQYFTYMKNKDIREIFKLEGLLMQWILKRIEGITIALEPEHTGGISKSFKYFNLLERLFFTGSLFNSTTKWNHL